MENTKISTLRGQVNQRWYPLNGVVAAQSLSRIQLFATPWTVAHQALLSMEFSRQEYWSGLPFPALGDLPQSGIEPMSAASPALQADSLPLCLLGSPDGTFNTPLKLTGMTAILEEEWSPEAFESGKPWYQCSFCHSLTVGGRKTGPQR